jgi:hypothetical protein
LFVCEFLLFPEWYRTDSGIVYKHEVACFGISENVARGFAGHRSVDQQSHETLRRNIGVGCKAELKNLVLARAFTRGHLEAASIGWCGYR